MSLKKVNFRWTLSFIFLLFLHENIEAKCLVREPPDTFSPPQDSDSGFYITVNGNPEFFEAGQLYTVTLRVGIFSSFLVWYSNHLFPGQEHDRMFKTIYADAISLRFNNTFCWVQILLSTSTTKLPLRIRKQETVNLLTQFIYVQKVDDYMHIKFIDQTV